MASNGNRNLEALIQRVLTEQAAMRGEQAAMRSEMQASGALVERVLRDQVAMRGEMKAGFQELREEIQRLRFVTGAAIRDHGRRLTALERKPRRRNGR